MDTNLVISFSIIVVSLSFFQHMLPNDEGIINFEIMFISTG